MIRYYNIIFLFSLILNSCTLAHRKKLEPIYLTEHSFGNLNDWKNDDFAEFWKSFQLSCEKTLNMPSEKIMYFGSFYKAGTYSDWHKVCKIAISKNGTYSNDKYRKFIEKNFKLYKVTTSKNQDIGFLTGYYEVDLKGSLKKTDKYVHPVHAIPQDFVHQQSYHHRKHIIDGIIDNQNVELAWVDDKVELFFMHIQGSGRIHLDNGDVLRVGYAAHNGHKFVPIGRVMLEKNLINKSQMNANSMKRWLKHNIELSDEIMNHNGSYIFFRKVIAEHGPIGAQGVELTALRSLAVDRRYYPLGILSWVETTLPASGFGPESKFRKLLMLQDTGSAIKGPIRGDLFFGHGKKASEISGNMKSNFKMFVLLPKNINLEKI
jgi:membrane-bound lytic murein transglycosylase A